MNALFRRRSRRAAWIVVMLAAFAVAAGAVPRSEQPAWSQHRVWIEGRVALADGSSAVGAAVVLRAEESAEQRDRRLLGGAPPAGPVAETRADDWGWFQLTTPGPGPWTLHVELDGHVPMERRILPVPGEQELAPLILPRARTERLRLVDPAGRPAADSWVAIASSSLDVSAGGWRRAAWAGFLGEEAVLELSRGEAEHLVLELGNAWGHERFEIGGPQDGRVDHQPWEQVALLEVRVVDSAGAGVADALIRIDGVPWTLTDAAGVAALPAPPEGGVEAIATDGRRGRLAGAAIDPGWLGEGDVTGEPELHPVTIEVEPLDEIRATVLSAQGEPISGAWVRAADSWWRSGTRGEVAIAVASAPGGRVEIGAVGHRWSVFALSGRPGRSAREPMELTLEPTSIAEGFVVDGAGRALAGAEIAATPVTEAVATAGGREAPSAAWARSRADGSFRLRDLAPNVLYELVASHPDLPDAEERFGAPGPREVRSDLRITLRSPRRVSGLVLRADDRVPVEGARVWIEGIEDRPVGEWLTATDSEGRFVWDEVPDGAVFDVHAVARGLAPGALHRASTPVGEAGDVDLGELLLEPGSRLDVLVRGAEGLPLEGATVAVDVGLPARPSSPIRSAPRDSGRWARRQTDVRGEARFDILREGSRVDVYVAHPEHVSVEVEGVRIPREAPLEVRLEPSASVAGTVTDELGRLLEGVYVAVFPQGPPLLTADDLFARTDEEGEYRIGGVPAGRHRVEARPFGRAEIEPVDLVAVAGERYRVDFRVPPSARVEGVVRDAWGAPVADAKVVAAGQLARSDDRGEFRLDHVRLGEHRFEVRGPEGRTVTRRVRIDGDLWLDFVLGGGAGIVGRVADVEGGPLARVGLRALELGGARSYRALSSEDGRFAFTDLEPGRYRIGIADFGLELLEDPFEVEVREEARSEVDVRVRVGRTTLRGRVSGLPADLSGEDVSVFLRSARSSHVSGGERDGTFHVDRLLPGEWTVKVRARRTFRSDGSSERRPVLEGSAEVLVRPGDREVFVEVHLESEDEDPRVRFSGRLTVDGAAPVGTYLVATSRDGSAATAPGVNALGEFEDDGVVPAVYDLVVAALDTSLTRLATVDLRRDAHVDLELFRMVVDGAVVDGATGRPVEGAEVFVLAEGAPAVGPEEHSLVVSAADGAFHVAALVPPRARLSVRAAGYEPAEAPVGPGFWGRVPVVLAPTSPP